MKFSTDKSSVEVAFDITADIVNFVVAWSSDPIGIKEKRYKEMNEEIEAVLTEYYEVTGDGSYRSLIPKTGFTQNDQAEIEYRIDRIKSKYVGSSFKFFR